MCLSGKFLFHPVLPIAQYVTCIPVSNSLTIEISIDLNQLGAYTFADIEAMTEVELPREAVMRSGYPSSCCC